MVQENWNRAEQPAGPGTVIQCDFDGTVTVDDVSFFVLDRFARGDWRRINAEYEAGRITVGRFNDEAMALVRATRRELLGSIDGNVKVRPGFVEFAQTCRVKGIPIVIVSNGFDFYIEKTLKEYGLGHIEFHAARTRFRPGRRVTVDYIGPDGTRVDDAFKERFVDHFLSQGFRVVYIGDGSSDFKPACKSHQVFARGTLLRKCREAGVPCVEFADFTEVARLLG